MVASNVEQGYYVPQQQPPGYMPQNYGQQNKPQSFYFVQNINEAYNWPIAPGNFLVFKDQDNTHLYTKSLGSPYDKFVFEVYTKDGTNQSYESTEKSSDDIESLKDEMSKIKNALRKLNDKISGKAGD